MKIRYMLYSLIGVMSLLVVVLVAAVFGAAEIGITDFFRAIMSKIPYLSDGISITRGQEIIIFNLRLPRILLALFAGVGLAVSGVVFQGVFSNPMAEPYLLGVSSGAAFGATLASFFELQMKFFSFGAMSVCAFVGAVAVVMTVYHLAMTRDQLPVTVLLLSGLAVNYFLSALMTLMMTLNHDKLESVYFWTLGSFRNANWQKVAIVSIVVLVCTLFIYYYARELDLILLGNIQAKSLGVEADSLKKRLLLVSSLMSAVIVASSGIIGFVGLIVPHAIRILTGPSHKRLIPLAALGGGILLIICDTIARSVLENKELSVGIITSLCGVPFFLWLLYTNRRAVN